MTRSTVIMSLAAASIGLAFTFAPLAFADEMSQPGAMTKTGTMGKKKDDGMKKDTMSDHKMSNGTMKKDDMKKDDMKK